MTQTKTKVFDVFKRADSADLSFGEVVEQTGVNRMTASVLINVLVAED